MDHLEEEPVHSERETRLPGLPRELEERPELQESKRRLVLSVHKNVPLYR